MSTSTRPNPRHQSAMHSDGVTSDTSFAELLLGVNDFDTENGK